MEQIDFKKNRAVKQLNHYQQFQKQLNLSPYFKYKSQQM